MHLWRVVPSPTTRQQLPDHAADCALHPPPQVAGVNFEEMVEAAVGEKLDLSKPLVDYESGNDVITVWLE